MDGNSDQVVAVCVPQVNVNDLEVTLVGWRVEDGGQAVEDEPLYEVETSKSVGDVPSPASGVLRHVAQPADVVGVGEVVGYVGPSAEAIDHFLVAQSDGGLVVGTRAEKPSDQAVTEDRDATIGAIELARRFGIKLADIPAVGKIRRSDVERYIADRGLVEPGGVERGHAERVSAGRPSAGVEATLPPAMLGLVEEQEALSDHQWAIAQHLTQTQSHLVTACVSMDVVMRAVVEWINAKRQAGVMVGPIPVLLYAVAEAISKTPSLASFRMGQRVYRYRAVHVAYTARSHDGRLFTPVVRDVDQRTLDEVAAEVGRLNMAVFRGSAELADLSGGCMTLSLLSDQPVRSHIGLQNAYQSAILTAGAIRDELQLRDDKPIAVPTLTLTLAYDHGLMDGWQAAECLATIKAALEAVKVS